MHIKTQIRLVKQAVRELARPQRPGWPIRDRDPVRVWMTVAGVCRAEGQDQLAADRHSPSRTGGPVTLPGRSRQRVEVSADVLSVVVDELEEKFGTFDWEGILLGLGVVTDDYQTMYHNIADKQARRAARVMTPEAWAAEDAADRQAVAEWSAFVGD